ncbi:amidophosphoribosyltransferase [Halarsenatibacter silvermanii]|uniref:Amidophosphoribosyltransferase n=1 Tax=Halarsenatibacter silvermanii TaxID=321763 RepID=A0A1G9HDI2_9FIRM|nr:amidophosphoribosyltransferase [Halarsenatibacter silvermanii]SDL10967.1 amidophosphoribosyltransferase [Halarsenatibacter silvermanii]
MAECDSREAIEEKCGVFGAFLPEDSKAAGEHTYLGLTALQHRGQESAGICVGGSLDEEEGLELTRGMGLVRDVFGGDTLNKLSGRAAIGHVRYSTSGSSRSVNAQPLLVNCQKGELALAHNGDLVNSGELRRNLESSGSIFHSTLDTEVIAHLVSRAFEDDIIEALISSLHNLRGAFSLVGLTQNPQRLVAIRDPLGFRPLALGKMEGGYLAASESCAFDILGAEYLREVEPGEMVIIDDDGIRSQRFSSRREEKFCVFEYIYFARPDSDIAGLNVQQARKALGRRMAEEMEIEADIVVPVPDSGVAAALGFAERSGLEYGQGILRNKYVGRTFIQPTQNIRDLKVRLKLSPIKEIVEDKRVILIDDSIVRGTTSNQIINRLREAGAAEVHMAISSPPVEYPCYFGLDITGQKELIANGKSEEEIGDKIGADSLHYLSREGMLEKLKERADTGFCTSCFDGDYPIEC